LLPLVYDELRRLAAWKLRQENPNQTLQATALVHEAWLRLAGPDGSDSHWKNRAHFFAAAAEAMRRILIEQARRKGSQKRGGNSPKEEFHDSRILFEAPTEEILAVHSALDQLEQEDPTAARVVKLRFFAGLSIQEIAQALDMSPRSADRHWAFARAWLRDAIQGG
jgi:RNA polymerase sigma factor (TIGR02999 family)